MGRYRGIAHHTNHMEITVQTATQGWSLRRASIRGDGGAKKLMPKKKDMPRSEKILRATIRSTF
jgi:hypothetical protein